MSNPAVSSRRAAFGGQLTSTNPPADGDSPASDSLPDLGYSLTPGITPPPGLDQTAQGPRAKGKGKANAGARPFTPKKLSGLAAAPNPDASTSGERDCFLCAEPATYWAVGECGHRTCDVCAVRMRALYKKTECAFCKTECPRVVFTSSSTLEYSDLPPTATPFNDSKLGLAFETKEQMDAAVNLLRFNCPVKTPPCGHILQGWADLKRHVRTDHARELCDLCISNKKIFADEHIAYAPSDLAKHIDKDHAPCGFCRHLPKKAGIFYDNDLLYKHCRDEHEECFICVRQGIRHQYHLNYERLEAHFKSAHFMCPHPTCLASKFIVFESEIDLQAHAVEAHGAHAGDQRARRDARRIDVNFETVPHRQQNRRPGRDGRMHEIQPVEASFVHGVDGPARTASGARVVPGLGPATGGGRAARFNGGLTSRDEPPHSGRRSGNNSRGATGSNTPAGSSNAEAVDPAVIEKHAALLQRVSNAVNSDAKVTSFKLSVRAYKSNEASAADLVDQLWNIFNKNEDVCSGVVSGLAELLDGDQRSALLGAWRDHRTQLNSFPSLSGLSSAVPTPAPRPANRHPNNTASGWTRGVEPAPAQAPARERFPALPSSSASGVGGRQVPGLRTAAPTPRPRNAGNGATPWGGATPVIPPPMVVGGSSGVPRSVPAVSRGTAPTVVKRQEFPSLPTSTTESDKRARMRAAMGKAGATVADSPPAFGGSAGPSIWGGSGEGSEAGGSSGAASAPAAGGGKKKKQGKVLLLSQGAIHRG